MLTSRAYVDEVESRRSLRPAETGGFRRVAWQPEASGAQGRREQPPADTAVPRFAHMALAPENGAMDTVRARADNRAGGCGCGGSSPGMWSPSGRGSGEPAAARALHIFDEVPEGPANGRAGVRLPPGLTADDASWYVPTLANWRGRAVAYHGRTELKCQPKELVALQTTIVGECDFVFLPQADNSVLVAYIYRSGPSPDWRVSFSSNSGDAGYAATDGVIETFDADGQGIWQVDPVPCAAKILGDLALVNQLSVVPICSGAQPQQTLYLRVLQPGIAAEIAAGHVFGQWSLGVKISATPSSGDLHPVGLPSATTTTTDVTSEYAALGTAVRAVRLSTLQPGIDWYNDHAALLSPPSVRVALLASDCTWTKK